MSKDNPSDFYNNWYELWMKQSKEFFETADKNLKDMFAKGPVVNPEENLKQINQWLDSLKSQWQFTQLTEEQKHFANYWKMMAKMFTDASDMMVEQWVKRNKEQDPIKNVRELYDLWLNCCQDVYKKNMMTQAYQDAYGEFMNAAMKFWKSYMPTDKK